MTYSFGAFRYDADQRLLFRGDELVPLAPKALDTLRVLVERRGSVVEKSELMKLVWPDTAVEEVGLARNISLLRKALEDESEERFIETIPRRGYRFVAPISTLSAHAPTPAPPAAGAPRPNRFNRRWWIAALCVLAAAFAYYQFYVPSRYLSGSPSASLALVPFDCLCPGIDGMGFSQGLDEVLVADLSKLPGVQVLSPSTVRRHQRVGFSMGLMGRLLGLDVLVEGNVQKLDTRFRITARLVDVHTGRLVWAQTYDTLSADSAAQETVAAALTAEIGKRLSHAAR